MTQGTEVPPGKHAGGGGEPSFHCGPWYGRTGGSQHWKLEGGTLTAKPSTYTLALLVPSLLEIKQNKQNPTAHRL